MNCIFCRIAQGEIPAYKIFENDQICVFLDISQGTEGHTLIIPKEHFDNVYALSETVSKDLFGVVPKVAKAIKAAFNPIGLNIISNNAQPYQTVNHFHIHLLPRYPDDALTISMKNRQEDYDEVRYQAVCDAIKNAL